MDPSSHWIKVVDDENDKKVVGAALWHVYEESPFAKPPEHEMTCYWWPEGPKRVMADQVMGQMMGPRVARMNKPHLCMSSVSTNCASVPYPMFNLGTLLLRAYWLT